MEAASNSSINPTANNENNPEAENGIKIHSSEDGEEGYDTDQDEIEENIREVVVEMNNDSSATVSQNNVAVVVVDQQNLDEKNCWVCFASEEDDPSALWTHPCK